jgi:hypothetical protein
MSGKTSERLLDFDQKLTAFLLAGERLSLSWERLGSVASSSVFEGINRKYPFKNDFHEVLADIAVWKEAVRKLREEGVLDWLPE